MVQNNEILECDLEFKCPKKWEDLKELDIASKRYCSSCDREIFFVANRKELEIQKKLGRCVAANVNALSSDERITVGGIYPNKATIIHVLGNQENKDELLTALDILQKKK